MLDLAGLLPRVDKSDVEDQNGLAIRPEEAAMPRLHRWLRASLCAVLLACSGQAVHASDLLGVTEDVPPFSYLEDGRYLGLANEVLDRIVKRSGLRIQRAIQPWARAQITVQGVPNSLLYVTVRAPAREKLYRWVGPIDDCEIAVLALASSGRSFTPSTPDGQVLRIGAVRGSPAGKLLRDAGVTERSIYNTPGSETSAKMLYVGHLDMIAGLTLPYAFQAARAGYDPSQLVQVHVLHKGLGCYFAFNLKVDDGLFKRFEEAFVAMQASGELKTLREQYLQTPTRRAAR